MINKEIIITDKIVLNPWEPSGPDRDIFWIRYMKNRFISEEYINTRVVITPFPFVVSFLGELRYVGKLFNHNKIYKTTDIEIIKEDVDQFLIKISKLQSFI